MFVILGGLAALWLALWLTRRRTRPPDPEPHAFTRAEIASYDTALPKYLLAAASSLLLGGAYNLVLQLPGVRNWLFLAGEPAHLLTEQVPEQLIVIGGVVMLSMALTCYALPRLIGRPLRNHNLARLSFVLTFAGVLLTALMTATVGTLQGLYVHAGGTYAQARAWLGPWERFPLWLFAGARDAGYWTFALLVVLTASSGHPVIWPRHRRRLTRWLLVSAGAFFLAVWQRLLEGLPGHALWLQNADEAAILVGHQGYVHLHLYAGALVPIATATFIYLLERKAERRIDWHRAERILAGLALAGAAFYLVRLALGLYEGVFAARYGRQAELAALSLGPWRPLLLGLSGLALLAALAGYLVYATRLARSARSYLPRATVGTLAVSAALAMLAGLHGTVLTVMPPGPSPGAHAHGTLALGTVLLLPALLLADSLLIDAAGAGPTASLAHAGLGFLGGGLVLAYLAGLGLGLGGPAASLAAAVLQFAGFLTFALHTYQATGTFRRALRARLRLLRPADAGPSHLALLELPLPQVLLIELLASLAGFPGFGWLFAGYTLAGALLLYIGPAVAWALLPSLFALSGGWLQSVGWNALVVYLPASALASTFLLRAALRRAGTATSPHDSERRP